jgi:hypothetical protein
MSDSVLRRWKGLSDEELRRDAMSLRERGRRLTVEMVGHLAEVERRGLHVQDAEGSLFDYARRELGLAEEEAYSRTTAARCVGRFPHVLELMESGALHLTSVRLLAGHLTSENHRDVLDQACGKTKREIEVMVAALAPRPDVQTTIRRLPATSSEPKASPVSLPIAPLESAPPPRTVVAPLSPERYRFQTTIGGATLDKLRLAQDLLSHAVGRGDDDAVLERALDALLEKLVRQKFAITDRPAAGGRATDPHSRHVPARVRRAVYLRDLGRCAHVGPTGRRCEARHHLEFHHLKPWMAGGEATIEKISLRCRTHNAYEARRFYDRTNGSPKPRPDGPGPGHRVGPHPVTHAGGWPARRDSNPQPMASKAIALSD